MQSSLILLAAGLFAKDFDFYACGSVTKGWTPSALQQSSGLLRIGAAPGQWSTVGYVHPYINAIAHDPRDSDTIYLAAGNGLIKSTDRGSHWRQLTDSSMTELQGVAVDPHAPDHVFVSLPDGIGYSGDGGATWTRRETGLKRKFTQVVRADRAVPGRLVAATESGVFVSSNGGIGWRQAGIESEMVFDVAQSPRNPRRWIAATQGGRAFESIDNGVSWRALATPKAHTLYNISFDASNDFRIALGGWGAGVIVTEDGGKTWEARNAGLPSAEVWRVAHHPENGSLYAYVHERDLYKSLDNGRTWQAQGMPGGVMRDLAFVPAANDEAYERRRARLMRHMAGPKGQTDPAYGGYATVAAKLYLKEDAEWCARRIRDLLREPGGDMFWMFMVTAVQYLDRGQLPESSRAEIRKAWKEYYPYRGDTENHWLLYYASLYLSSQLEPEAQWYTGKTSKENMREAGDHIRKWIDLTLAKGQGEYDCTHYIGVYLLPLSYLAAWAEDADLRQRARMMIEYITADFAAELLDGVYVGAHARTDDTQVLEKSRGVSSDFAWLLFDQGPEMTVNSGYAMYYAAAWGRQPPEILRRIATDRSKPYLHREKKRTRNRWRFSDERNGPVYKTTYMTARYAVGSDQGGVLQPIQQHSWDVTWKAANPRGAHNTLFTTHPYSSARELQTYFTPMPDYFLDEVLRSKKSYDSPDKWIGGSPYEQILQDLDTVVVLYDIPEGVRHPHIHGFFSRDLARFEEDASGWIFAQGGDAYLAYLPLAPYRWNKLEGGGRELFSPHLKNGAIVQAADRAEFQSFEEFKAKMRGLRISKSMTPTPTVEFVSLRGNRLRATFGTAPLDYASWPPFDGPFVRQAAGSRKLEMRHEKMRRVLDFDNLKVIEASVP